MIKKQLLKILQSIRNENISMGEIVFLQAHQAEIKKLFPNEPDLWQWAEIDEQEYLKAQGIKND